MLRHIVLLSVALTLAACAGAERAGSHKPPSPAATAPVAEHLDDLAERYFDRTLALSPVFATFVGDHRYNDRYLAPFDPDVRSRQQALVRATEAELASVRREALDPERQVTFDLLAYSLRMQREGERYPSHLLPLNQFFNFTAQFAQLGAGGGLHPFRTVKDYDDFLGRIAGFDHAVDVAIANMREGVATGVVQPRVLMERALPQLEAHVVADPATSLFYGPVKAFPGDFSAADRERLTAAYTAAIRDRIVPAFRRLHAFVRDDYLPHTRDTAGLAALPDGKAWYAYQVRSSTTTSLTPAEVHAIGLAEVARLHGEIAKVMGDMGWEGDLAGFMRQMQADPALHFSTREEMLAAYRATQARIDASTDRLFDLKPKANYEIRPIEGFRERSASKGSYTAAALDGSRPGVFYLNTYAPTSRARAEMETLLVHEGSPGHHFQISIARELTQLPRLRRFGGYTAYSEGWGLYAETLGPELGLFKDPVQHYGFLSSELWRAIRLVLDTGIHDQGWSLEQATAYARANSSQSEEDIRSEVERFAAIPGQALAYKIGERKITELRERARQKLGPRFDARAFHRAVLDGGALPLEVLERKDRSLDRGAGVKRAGVSVDGQVQRQGHKRGSLDAPEHGGGSRPRQPMRRGPAQEAKPGMEQPGLHTQ